MSKRATPIVICAHCGREILRYSEKHVWRHDGRGTMQNPRRCIGRETFAEPAPEPPANLCLALSLQGERCVKLPHEGDERHTWSPPAQHALCSFPNVGEVEVYSIDGDRAWVLDAERVRRLVRVKNLTFLPDKM